MAPRNFFYTFYPWIDGDTYYHLFSTRDNDYLADELLPKREVAGYAHFGGLSMKPLNDESGQVVGIQFVVAQRFDIRGSIPGIVKRLFAFREKNIAQGTLDEFTAMQERIENS